MLNKQLSWDAYSMHKNFASCGPYTAAFGHHIDVVDHIQRAYLQNTCSKFERTQTYYKNSLVGMLILCIRTLLAVVPILAAASGHHIGCGGPYTESISSKYLQQI